ncbi:hypothetical protein D5086_032696 [Populus alba]|uniref:Uncharacterized protein n=1 Tax=Populus alba TaxID=43335 RepID=A0ACC4AER5_POPAL
MSLANSCALLLLFFLTLSLFITCSTAANTIGVTHTTVAVAADNVPFPKKVATFLPSDISPPTEKYCCQSGRRLVCNCCNVLHDMLGAG